MRILCAYGENVEMMGVLLLGLLAGITHALEIDHLAAVASMVSGKSSRRAIVNHGIAWGIGHGTTLLVVTIGVLATGRAFEEGTPEWLEFGVGLMLVGLGLHVFWRMRRDKFHFHMHRHGSSPAHVHFHSHLHDNSPHAASDHRHDHSRLPGRALAVGTMHGLAGSAALVVLTAASFGNIAGALAFVMVFGLGSIAGMAILSTVLAVPLAWSATSLVRANRAIQIAIGTLTLGVGSILAYGTKLHVLFGA